MRHVSCIDSTSNDCKIMQETSGHKARFIVPIILPFIMTIFWNVRTLRELLPPANVVCEGYVFTGVCLSTGEGCAIPACIAGGIPACLAAGLWGEGGMVS